MKNVFFCLLLTCLIPVFSTPVCADDFSDDEVSELDQFDDTFVERKQGAIVELSGISSLGNSNTGSFFLGTEVFLIREGHWLRFDGSTYYAEGEDTIAARITEGRVELARILDSRNYIISTGVLRHNLMQRLNLRSSIGLGFGHKLIKVSFEELAFEAGIGIQNENFSGAKSSSYTEGQFGIKYLFRFSETAAFENRSSYLPSLKNLRDYRIRSEFKLSDTIHNNVGILIRVIFDFDGSPIDSGVDRLDTRIFGGVTYNFLD